MQDLLFHALNVLARLLELRRETLCLGNEVGGLGVQHLGRRVHTAVDGLHLAQVGLAGDRLHAAHAGRDRALARDAERADLGGVVHMRAAAELNGLAAHVHHAHEIAVLLAEERRRAAGLGLRHRHLGHGDVHAVEDPVADDLIDPLQLLGRDGREMRQVKAQAIRLHERARLMHVIAQHLAQRGLEQVRGRVRTHDRLAAIGIDARRDGLLDLQAAGVHHTVVQEFAGLVLLDVRHLEERAVRLNDAVVGHLAAHLGIKRRAVEHEHALLALIDLRTDLTVADDGQDRALVDRVVIAGEFRRRRVQAEVHTGPCQVAERLARLSRAHALLLHQLLERILIHGHVLLLHHLAGQVNREAVGVIELERIRAGEHPLALGLMLGEQVGEDVHAGVDGLGEVLLLVADDAGDIRLLLAQLGVLALVFVHDHVHDLIQERFVDAEELAVARRAAQQTAQHIAAALVRRQDTVRDHHDGGADMVGDDAQGHVGLVAVTIVRAGDLADLVGDVHDGIDVEERIHALADNGQALKAHAGVNVFLNEIGVVAVAVVVKLGKDVVPDLHIAVAVAAGRAVRLAAAIFFTAVKIDLRAGAARAGAMLPEVIVLAEAGDAALGNADLVAPDVERLVVLFIHGRVQPLGVEADPVRARQELPRPCDGFMLEVVAEGEVAEHLKIRAVARGLADVLDIAGADALLAGADAMARRLLVALEVGLHRRHAGVDEQQARVILRDEREARQTQVSLRLEKAQEHFAQFIQTIWFHNHLSSKSNSLASLFLQPLGKAGHVRAVKLQLAAAPAGIDIDLQRTGKEVGQVAGQKAVLPELQGFLPQMLHLAMTTQTVHNTSPFKKRCLRPMDRGEGI